MTDINGKRLTRTQSIDMMIQDSADIPVIPPLRIKLEAADECDKSWFDIHANMGDHVEVIKMHPGGDIVHGLSGDDLSCYLDSGREAM